MADVSSVWVERVRWKEIKNKTVKAGLEHDWELCMTPSFGADGYMRGERRTCELATLQLLFVVPAEILAAKHEY